MATSNGTGRLSALRVAINILPMANSIARPAPGAIFRKYLIPLEFCHQPGKGTGVAYSARHHQQRLSFLCS
jgi:hypothetical protein